MFKIAGQPDQISDFKLKASYWYITHKLQLRRALVVFLIVLSAGFFSYSIYKATSILLIQDKDFNQAISSLSSNLIDYEYFHQKNKPLDLQILDFDVIEGTENRKDFVVHLNNPNEKWVAQNALVQLISGGEVVEAKNTFIYPGESKYLVFFNQENASLVTSQIRIATVDWQRQMNFTELASQRLNFAVSEVEFKSAFDSGVRGKLPVSILSFKIKNATAYSYYQLGIYMILLSTQKVGGANYLALDQFRSGEERTVEMRWYESLPAIYKIEIIPEVDILNQASYMPAE